MIESNQNLSYDEIKRSLARGIISPHEFEQVAASVYNYQLQYNSIFAQYVASVSRERGHMTHFLPISAFKVNLLKSKDWDHEMIYTSSGSTGTVTSRHAVRHVEDYLQNCRRGFEQHYGRVERYSYLALLPSYLEREGSSLIAMMQHFVEVSGEGSGFYLYNHEELYQRIMDHQSKGIPTVLFGVSFALLDFCKAYEMSFPDLIVMETGGMKGRAKEMAREDLHKDLSSRLGVSKIHSEYGMTELMSQCYSKGDGIFYPTNTIKVTAREINDPFTEVKYGKTGVLHIVDLANVDTCSFIATEDLGVCYPDGSFRLIGRLDHSDLRGCNLLLNE